MQARLILMLALVGYVGLTATPSNGQTAEAAPTLVVIGEAEQVGTPDVALLILGVTQEGDTASEALRAATRATRTVIESARKFGLESHDIQTSGLSIQPRYARPRSGSDERAQVVGYSSSNQLSLRVRGLERLGELLDGVVASGSNDIRGLNFDITDRAKLLDVSRARAVEDATHKATLYAKAAGIRLGEIINLQEEGASQQGRPTNARAGALESAAAVPIEAGEIALRARVRITWRILK